MQISNFLPFVSLVFASPLQPELPEQRAQVNLPKTKEGDKTALQQRLVCYERTGQYGESYSYTDYAPFLNNFDNRIQSCCFDGVWILYGDVQYNGGNTMAHNFWAYGENYCTDMPSNFISQASSLRYTGHPSDMYQDSINMYFNEYFMGDEEFAYSNSPILNYDNRAQSIIVTGYQWWTIYEYPNYQGYSACLAPGNNGFPGFYSTRASLHSLANDVSSIALGCHSAERLYPDNHKMRMEANNNNGTNGFSFFH